jgi:hypothetical protein
MGRFALLIGFLKAIGMTPPRIRPQPSINLGLEDAESRIEAFLRLDAGRIWVLLIASCRRMPKKLVDIAPLHGAAVLQLLDDALERKIHSPGAPG